MKKLKIYLDTSVISYLDQKDSPHNMRITQRLWTDFEIGKYDIYLSKITIDELEKCDFEKQVTLAGFLDEILFTKLLVNEETEELANKIIQEGILTQKSYDDCLHIAAATLAECDIILSWNFKHLVNVKTIRGVRGINMLKGYNPIDICSPDMFIEEE
jgi:predicted nucleic acid-binding protein